MRGTSSRRLARGNPRERAAWKRRFLASLAVGLTVHKAARRAGCSPASCFNWRDNDEVFAAMWAHVNGRRTAALRRLRHDAEGRDIGESLARLIERVPPRGRVPIYGTLRSLPVLAAVHPSSVDGAAAAESSVPSLPVAAMPEAATTAAMFTLRVHDAGTMAEALNDFHAVAPGELWVTSKQAAFVEDATPYVALVGGIGSGKTRAGVIKALLTMERHPGVLGVVAAPTIDMLDTTVRTFRELLPPERYTFIRSLPQRIVLDNGSEVIFRTTDEPDRLRGPNLAFVYMDEAAMSSEEAFRVLQGRLRQRVASGDTPYRHQLWLTTTPKGHNWFYREFAARETHPQISQIGDGVEGDRRDHALHRLSARDNPFLPESFVPRLERDYQGDFAAQEIDGEFVAVGNKPYFSVEATNGLLHDCSPATAKRGLVKVWQEPDREGRYVVGADIAWGEKGSYSCAVVLDYATGTQVAELHGRPEMHDVATELLRLCNYYNQAYLGIERNGEASAVVQKLVGLGYKFRMYRRKDAPNDVGWHTDMVTRPHMLLELSEAINAHPIVPRSEDLVRELLGFVRDEHGRPGHVEGAHDDRVIALAIAWQMRHHATFATTGPVPSFRGKGW